jgi:putative endonuclease
MAHNTALGAHGEDLAAAYLTSAGLHIEQRNWRCRFGEIDIVAWERDVLAIVEVKTRRGRAHGLPIEAVDGLKQQRLRRLGAVYLSHRRGRPHWVPTVRFDVVSVLFDTCQAPEIEHYRGVF